MPRKKSPKPSNRFSDPTILTAPAGVIRRVFFVPVRLRAGLVSGFHLQPPRISVLRKPLVDKAETNEGGRGFDRRRR